MNKRGQDPLTFLMELVIAIVIIGVFIYLANSWGRGEGVKQVFLTKDTALLIDSFHSVSGNASLNYRTQNFTADLKFGLQPNYIELKQQIGSTNVFPFRSGALNILTNELDIDRNKVNVLVFTKTQREIFMEKK
jgi:hypothetical protein